MFNRNSLRLGLTGAVLFILVGGVSACSDQDPMGVEPVAQFDSTPNCTIVNGVIICADDN